MSHSDQPKPATGEYEVISPASCKRPTTAVARQATGEWTADTVGELSRFGYDKGVADAHNAALAAERERVKGLADEWWGMALAAATAAAQQPLVDALTEIKTLTLPTNECYRIAEAGIAKVKEGK